MEKKECVKTFQTRAEAEMAQSYLRSHDISCQITADDCGGMHPALTIHGAGLLVSKKDLKRAGQLLEQKK